MPQTQNWFEFRDMRGRTMDRDAWIVLRACQSSRSTPERYSAGHEEEFFGAVSVAIPNSLRQVAEKTISWGDLSLAHDNAPYVQDGVYHASDEFSSRDDISGTYLVLSQMGNAIDSGDWIVHPDLVLGLRLKREGDQWLSLNEGYIPVIRMTRNQKGSPTMLEIRASHLKDFLSARSEFLAVSTYRSREVVAADRDCVDWAKNPLEESSASERWQGSVTEITPEGHLYGSQMAILHVGRKDFDLDQDVPQIGHTDEFETDQRTRTFEGEKLFRVWGELWKVYFINAGENSTRVRGDDLASSVFFYTDAAGQRESADDLEKLGRWLWFKPDVINQALSFRGAFLEWYTAYTGRVSMGPDGGVHFGVNKLGLVNVYAKDIRYSSSWQQQVWAGFNVTPEGGVSKELLMAQAEGDPAETQAPEPFLQRAILTLNRKTQEAFGFNVVKPHPDYDRLLKSVHRFRATDEDGFYALAKDIARLTADSFDIANIQKIVKPPSGAKWGSLKSMEHLLATRIPADKARSLMTPLVGVYELRLADAHLPSEKLDGAFSMVHMNRGAPWVQKGMYLIAITVEVLQFVARILATKPTSA